MRPSPRFRSGKARKRFGQHFLEPAWVAKLVGALDAHRDDTFLEIGPGRGALTVPLAGKVRKIVAVEIDEIHANSLKARKIKSSTPLLRAEPVAGERLRA